MAQRRAKRGVAAGRLGAAQRPHLQRRTPALLTRGSSVPTFPVAGGAVSASRRHPEFQSRACRRGGGRAALRGTPGTRAGSRARFSVSALLRHATRRAQLVRALACHGPAPAINADRCPLRARTSQSMPPPPTAPSHVHIPRYVRHCFSPAALVADSFQPCPLTWACCRLAHKNGAGTLRGSSDFD